MEIDCVFLLDTSPLPKILIFEEHKMCGKFKFLKLEKKKGEFHTVFLRC